MDSHNQDLSQQTFNDTDEQETYSDAANNKNDWKEIKNRNLSYTRILERYYQYIDNVLTFKENQRKTIYICSLILLILPIIGLIVILSVVALKDLTSIENLIAFTTALGAVISSIFVLPSKVGDYLFNNDETQQIIEIIKNIQDYDKNVRIDIRERQKDNKHD